MIKLHVTNQDGSETVVDGTEGLSLMECLREADVEGIAALCGGSCSCATCHIYVDDAWTSVVGKAGDDEEDLLSDEPNMQESSRLSCQVEVTAAMNGLKIAVPQDV